MNLINTSIFTHKVKTGTGPAAFHTASKMPSHSYQIRFSRVNYSKPKTRLRKSSFRMSMRVPAIWKNVVPNAEKEIEHIGIFK